MSPNVFINYVGFDPSPEDKNFLSHKLHQLRDLAPSTATITVDFIKESGRILGVKKVFFGEKPFSALSENTDFKDLILELSRSIKHQITDWKKDRFAADTAAI